MNSLVLDAVCWDKDRFGKDYMGELDVALEEAFADREVEQEVCRGAGFALKSFVTQIVANLLGSPAGII